MWITAQIFFYRMNMEFYSVLDIFQVLLYSRERCLEAVPGLQKSTDLLRGSEGFASL